jgi:hypothetical protein
MIDPSRLAIDHRVGTPPPTAALIGTLATVDGHTVMAAFGRGEVLIWWRKKPTRAERRAFHRLHRLRPAVGTATAHTSTAGCMRTSQRTVGAADPDPPAEEITVTFSSVADRAALREHVVELKELLEAGDELAVRAAAREAAIAWRAAAMRAQLESVRPGERISFLKARPEIHVTSAPERCRSAGHVHLPPGRACPSCGEPSRVRGGRCDPCFAAALGVVPTDVLVKGKGQR